MAGKSRYLGTVGAMILGAHIPGDDPLGEAKSVGASCLQMFVGPPQSWKKPPPRPDADKLKKSKFPIYVHAPYLINVASPNNRIRIPSRKILANTVEMAATVGALGVIVHAGHAEDGIDRGFIRWYKVFEEGEFEVPILIENTAGGTNAMGRQVEVLAKLWEQLEGFDVGFCFDTCHAHAAGEDLAGAVERVTKICGRIDLLHANDSRDPPGTGADRHANLGRGEMDADALRAMIRAAKAPVVCETPGTADDMRADLAFVREALGG